MCFVLLLCLLLYLHPFPTRRSSDLAELRGEQGRDREGRAQGYGRRLARPRAAGDLGRGPRPQGVPVRSAAGQEAPRRGGLDRKSTRLNSSHLGISYAVFCLKKKKKN